MIKYNGVQEAVKQFKLGNFVVIVDEDREGEADLIVLGEKATPKKIAFIINNTSGILCIATTKEYKEKFGLKHMVENNTDRFNTNFLISIDHKNSHTGVSAVDRCKTVQAFCFSDDPYIFTNPGHMFPLLARDRLLKERKGHTEASITLCELAGKKKVAVLSELMNKNGTTMDKKRAYAFSRKNNIPIVSIGQLYKFSSSIS